MNQSEREAGEQSGFLRELSSDTGDSFFSNLALGLCGAVRAEGLLLCEFVGAAGTRMHTVAGCRRGASVGSFRFDLPRSLWNCEAEAQQPLRKPQLRGLFLPEHPMFGLDLLECMVWPLTDPTGICLGLLMIFHPQHPLTQSVVQDVASLLGTRVIRELERRRADALLQGEKSLLELLAGHAPQQEVLTHLAQVTEENAGDVFCAILLRDRDSQNLRLATAPSLPESYRSLIETIPIGPDAGPSGRAAHSKQSVIIADVAGDPAMNACFSSTGTHNIRSAWATPIFSGEGEVWGTIAMYSKYARAPLAREQALIDRAVKLAGIAIEHQRVEAEQRESERQLRLLAGNAKLVILSYDMQRRLLYVNPAVKEQTGYSVEEMYQRQFIPWIHPEDNPRMTGLWERLFHGEGYSDVEFRIITKTGGVKWILGSWGPLLDEGGQQIGIQGRELDITDRKEAEERLRRSETRLAKAQEIAHLGTWEQDLISDELYWSEETHRIFGVPPDQRITPELFYSCVAPGDRDLVRISVQKALEEWRAYAVGHRIIRPDGGERYVHEQAEIVRDSDGKAVRMIGTVQDITQSRRLEEQLRQAQKMEAVGQLAGGVAHDFNNLLTAIIGHSELLLHKLAQNHPLRQEIEEIKKAGERAALLTRQLLAFSRKQVLQPVVLDLNSLVESMSKMLRRLIREDIHLVTSPCPGLWYVKADPGQMQQVILNLVLNARDAMPKGGTLAILLSNVDLNEAHQRRQVAMNAGHYVMLSVSDSGEGMDAGTRARIFEPFFTTKEQGKGTGLGLSTVYGIIKQSGGYIWVDSESGKGTTFDIYLPQVDEACTPASEPADTRKRSPASKTILLVEDDTSVRAPIRRMLERSGYRILEAGDAEEALQTVQRHDAPLDLMLTDVVMPRMGGRELAERIAAIYPRIRVLYMSGYADDVAVREAAAEQDRDFIEKPFTGDTLVRKVREILDDTPDGPENLGV